MADLLDRPQLFLNVKLLHFHRPFVLLSQHLVQLPFCVWCPLGQSSLLDLFLLSSVYMIDLLYGDLVAISDEGIAPLASFPPIAFLVRSTSHHHGSFPWILSEIATDIRLEGGSASHSDVLSGLLRLCGQALGAVLIL